MNEFQDLLRKAVGSRSQAQFAREAGIAAPQLNRMLRQEDGPRPAVSTLEKIAGHAQGGVTLLALLRSCGYPEETLSSVAGAEAARRMTLPIDERVQLCEADYKAGFERMLGDGAALYDSLADFMDAATSLYGVEDAVVDIEEEADNPDGSCPADMACPVTVSFSNFGEKAEIEFGIYYSVTRKGKIAVIKTTTRLTDLVAMGGRLAAEVVVMLCEDDEAQVVSEVNDVLVVREKRAGKPRYSKEYWDDPRDRSILETPVSAEERLLKAIFGNRDPNAEKVPLTSDGPGFYTDAVPAGCVREFLKNHRETFCRSDGERDIYRRLAEEGGDVMANDAFKGMPEECSRTDSFEGAVCNIIRRETGIRLSAIPPHDGDGNRRCVMFEAAMPWHYNGAEKELTRETLWQLLDRYALELRTEPQDCRALIWIDADEPKFLMDGD